jgi:precorrin-2 dehydrogenase/sirohydrochlorin ferrochelatase
MLDLSDRLVVIIGGGAVAARKAKGLLAAGAMHIRIVAPEMCDAIPGTVERIYEVYAAQHLDEAGLVFAATNNSDVNAAVVRDAHRLGLLVNRADSAEDDAGDFSTPAVLREEELIVTVSAGGSPTLAAAVRDDLHLRLDARWVKLSRATKTLRPRVVSDFSIELRRTVLRDMVTPEAMEVLDRQGIDGLWNWVRERHAGGK